MTIKKATKSPEPIKATSKKLRGGQHKYNDTYPDNLLRMMKDGYLNCQICTSWNISEDTFYRWLKEYDDLKEAYDVGVPACESYWVDWGMKGMRGEVKGFSFNAWIAFMNNKFKWAKNALADPGNTTNISIGNMNVLQQTRPELIQNITSLLEKHKDTLDLVPREEHNE